MVRALILCALALSSPALAAVQEVPSVQPPVQPLVQGPVDPREARFNQCLDRAIDDPLGAIDGANKWLADGGSYFARHCLAFAYSRQQRWLSSAQSFALAAEEARTASDNRAANLWLQAANAALAGSQPSTSLSYIDSAIATGILEGQALGLAHLDRARALVALEQLQAARAEFVLVQQYAPNDPLGWLLSATLERRLGNLERALADINVAVSIVPGDPDTLLEAGVIAAVSGDYEKARELWTKVSQQLQPSIARLTARQYLKQLDEDVAGE